MRGSLRVTCRGVWLPTFRYFRATVLCLTSQASTGPPPSYPPRLPNSVVQSPWNRAPVAPRSIARTKIALPDFLQKQGVNVSERHREAFFSRCSYIAGGYDSEPDYQRLHEHLCALEGHAKANRTESRSVGSGRGCLWKSSNRQCVGFRSMAAPVGLNMFVGMHGFQGHTDLAPGAHLFECV